MSIEGAENQVNPNELFKPNPNLQEPSIIKTLDYLNIKNNFHNMMLCSLKSNIAKEISDSKQDEGNRINPSNKIKYKSNILKVQNLQNIINLKILDGINSNRSLDLLNNFQKKANNFLNKNEKMQEKENENINIKNIDENESERKNINSYLDRKKQIKNNYNLNK